MSKIVGEKATEILLANDHETILHFCRGHSQFVQLMKEFAYSLVEGALCPLAGGGQPLSYTRTSFYMEAVKLPPASLSGRIFTSSPGDNRADYVQFPEEVISVPAPVSARFSLIPRHLRKENIILMGRERAW